MGITIQPKGMAGLYGAAAVTAKQQAEARRAEEQRIRREEIQIQQQYQTNTKLLDAQLDLEMYERSKRWEIDKMELSSRMDFEREEKTRQRALDEYDATVKFIKDSDLLNERQKETQLFKAKLKILDQDIAGIDMQALFPDVYKRGGKESVLSLLGGGKGVSPMDMNIGDPLGLNIQSPDITTIPLSAEVQQLEAQNKFRVISPNGNEEIIDASEWPAKKVQGYILADVAELRERKPRETIRRFAVGKF